MKITKKNRKIKRHNMIARGRNISDFTVSVKRLTAVGLFLGVGVLFVYLYDYLMTSDRFVVRNVSVEGNNIVSDEDIVKLSGVVLGVNIFKTNARMMKNKLYLNTMIKNVNISRKLPSTIVINIKERKPVAVIKSGDRMFQINEDKTIFYGFKNNYIKNLPIITGVRISDDAIGKKCEEPAVLHTLLLIQAVRKKFPDKFSVNAEDAYNLIVNYKNTKVKFGNQQFNDKVKKLKAIFDDLSLKKQKAEEIDLRFRDEAAVLIKKGG